MKKYLLALTGLVALLFLVPLVQGRLSTDALPAEATQAEAQQFEPISLDESMAPLVRYFNEGKEKPRLVVLLSPT